MLEVVGRGPSGEQTARWRWQTRYTLSPWFGLVDG